MSNIAQFEQVIGQLLSPDNTVRGHAENIFNEFKKSPDFLVSSLVQLIVGSQHVEVRSLSAVLLRRVLSKNNESLWPGITPQTQGAVKSQLLSLIETEKDGGVRSKVSDLVAHIGSLVLEKGGEWNELLPFMFKCSKSHDESQRESALEIFAHLANHIGDKLRPFFGVLKDVLAGGLQDPSLKVKVAALTATVSMLHVLDQAQERQVFQQLTPLMLAVISSALNAQDEDEARSAIEVFVELAESDPLFLKPSLHGIVPAMSTIATTASLEDDTKHLALEFLLTLTETKSGMMRKYPKILELILPIIFNMMLDMEDTEEWHKGDNKDDDDVDITNSDIGEESLDRIALAIGGKLMVPAVFAVLQSMLSNPDWRYRHTGLLSISIIGEGCHKFILPTLGEVIKLILPFFADPHPRVRWAACNTIGQMSTDFGPDLQKLYHAQILPALAAVMDDKANPRVQSHAASALINFCEHCNAELIAPYLEPLMAKLFTLLQVNKTIVQEQAITAIAAVADSAEASFDKFYDPLMPYLKNIMANANGKEYRMLRGKAMECASLIGVAVGKEKFSKDAKEIMELMSRTTSTALDPDDPQVSFLLQSWARICRCLGPDFVPFLPQVMPPLLASAKISPDIKISEEQDHDENKEEEGWDYIPVGDKRIGIHTSGLEEKATACNMIYCYVSELKEGFFPYTEEVTKLLVPLMRFYYHDGVRSAAVTTMPHLLRSASEYFKKAGAATGADVTYIRNLFNFMFPSLVESIKEEVDLDILSSSVGTLADCINTVGTDSLSPEQVKQSIDVCLGVIDEVKDRRKERAESAKEEDADEEEQEKLVDESERDDGIVSDVGDVFGALAHHNSKNFLPVFQQFALQTFVEFINPVSKPSDRQTAVCVFDDIAEYGGPAAYPYYQHFLPHVITYITDDDASVRQAAVYGMGVFAQFGGDQIGSLIPDIYNRLKHVISLPNARDDTYVLATENAIGSVAKIIRYQSKAIDVTQVIPQWLAWLPVKEDDIESKVTYGQLLYFIETSSQLIFGQGYQNLPVVLSIFGEIVGTHLVDEEQSAKIVAILKQVQSSLPAEVLAKAWASLSAPHQQNLQQAVTKQ